MSPKIAGAMAATTKYDVTVRLIFDTDTSSASDRDVMAGKKINDDNGEKHAANVLSKIMRHFRCLLNPEYGNCSVSVVIASSVAGERTVVALSSVTPGGEVRCADIVSMSSSGIVFGY